MKTHKFIQKLKLEKMLVTVLSYTENRNSGLRTLKHKDLTGAASIDLYSEGVGA